MLNQLKMTTTWTMLLVLVFVAVSIEEVLANKVYRVTTIQSDPYTIVKSVPGGARMYQGLVIDIVNQLRGILGVEFNVSLVPDGRYGSMNPTNGLWDGMIGQLIRREADIAAAPLTVTHMRSRVVDFTQPFMTTGTQVLLKRPVVRSSGHSTMLLLFSPFSVEMWITLAVAYIVVTVSLYVISHWSSSEWRQTSTDPEAKETFGFGNSWLFTTSTLLLQGYRKSPKSVAGRMLSVFWWMFVLFIIAAYIAALAGRLIAKGTPRPMETIRTFQDLYDSGVQFGVIKGSSTEQLFKYSRNELKQKMWRKLFETSPSSMVSSAAEGLERVSKTGNYAFITEGSQLKYFAAKNCEVYVAEAVMGTKGLAFACSIGSDICQKLNLALLKMKEDERLESMEKMWFSGVCPQDEGRVGGVQFRFATTQLENSSLAFILLAFGIVVSLLACGVENCLTTRRKLVPPTHHQVPGEPVEYPAGCNTKV